MSIHKYLSRGILIECLGATRQNHVFNHLPIQYFSCHLAQQLSMLSLMIVTWVNFPSFVSQFVIDVKMVLHGGQKTSIEVQFVNFHYESITVDKKKNKPKAFFFNSFVVVLAVARANRVVVSKLRARERKKWEKTEKSHLVCGMKICIFSTFQYATTKNTNVVCRSTVAATKKKNRVAINFN